MDTHRESLVDAVILRVLKNAHMDGSGGFLDVKGAVFPGVLYLSDIYLRTKESFQERLLVVSLEELRIRCDYLVTQRYIDINESDYHVAGYSYVYDKC
jgi:hypothetical protein